MSIIITLGNFCRLRFNDLLNKIEGITAKTLTDRLRELKGLGLVTRRAYHEIPLRVEYELTQEGKRLMKAITPLIQWSLSKR